jgi:hypothetical protein
MFCTAAKYIYRVVFLYTITVRNAAKRIILGLQKREIKFLQKENDAVETRILPDRAIRVSMAV